MKMARVLAVLLPLLLPRLAAGGSSRQLTSPDFSAGTGENFEIKDGYLTLYKQWSFGGAGPDQMAARSLPGFAFDENRGAALMFGGKDINGAALGDTWLWSSGVWTKKNPTGAPSPRYGHALVWAGDKFVLYGGNNNSETWTYDIGADTWTMIDPVSFPPVRDLPAMAYDTDLGRAVLFGGNTDGGTWIYDVAAGTWSALTPVPSPPDRSGAVMAYDRNRKKMVLFGGKNGSGALLNDTWVFDGLSGTWTQQAPATKPEARWLSAAAYDTVSRGVFLYGGYTNSYTGDLWYYNFSRDQWSQHYESDPNESMGRYAHSVIYDTSTKRTVIFGGIQNGAVKSTWLFRFTPAAVWTSGPVDAWAGYSSTTALHWETVSAVYNEQPADTGALLQLSFSQDGIAYDEFRGPDGSSSTFYTAGAPVGVWAGSGEARYVKMKAWLFSDDPPGRPKIAALQAAYDRAPFAPALTAPAAGSRTNNARPLLQCGPASDPDGIFSDWPLQYQLQLSTDPAFSVSALSDGLALINSLVSYTPAAALPEGRWYWRARARDPAGLYGNWSPAFDLLLDTHTPPSPVTVFTAARGTAVNTADLTWTFPGDDKGRVDNGTYRIRYSSLGPITTEGEWSAASERTGPFSADPGGTIVTTVGGLPGDTTVYFAIKTQDELGNLSDLSSVSPFMKTDSSPTITLQRPNGGEYYVRTATISWTMADADPGDELSVSLFLSTDSGAHYGAAIASGLAPATTSYLWDSALVPNGSAYRVKAVVSDQRGLSASDSSDGDFEAENTNNTPYVNLSGVPAAGEEVSGTLSFSWLITDANSLDTHTSRVYLSADSGATYSMLASGLTVTTYSVNTAAFVNGTAYRIKVMALDSGTPQLSGATESPVFRIVNTLPPKVFSLLKPLEGTMPSVFDLAFAWEPAIDPEGGPVTYELQYSTTSGPDGGVTVGGLVQPRYTPPLNSLTSDTEYFWKVTALDQYLKRTDSAAGRFTAYSRKAKSPDGMLFLEVLSGMPGGGYISFRDAKNTLPDAIGLAYKGLLGNRTVKAVTAPAWDARIQDISGNVLPSGNVYARLTFNCPEAEKAAAVDGALSDITHLRIARLDPAGGTWEIQQAQTVDAGGRNVTAEVKGLTAFSVVAALPLSANLSGLTAFPNPFAAGRERIKIRYSLAGDAEVRIRIYTPLGDLVRVLTCPAGTPGCGEDGSSGFVDELEWDGRNGQGRIVANGMYTAEIYARSAAGAKKELLNIGVLK